MATTLPPHMGFFSLGAEIRAIIYNYIPNAIVRHPVQLIEGNKTSAGAKSMMFFPASTIRQTCKFIAHEAKPLVRKHSRRDVRSQNYYHSFRYLILEESDLELLTYESSYLSLACRWYAELRNYNAIRRYRPRNQTMAEFRDLYRDWFNLEAFKLDENIEHLDIETSTRIALAGMAFGEHDEDGRTITIMVFYGKDGELPSAEVEASCTAQPVAHEAIKAMAEEGKITLCVHYEPHPGMIPNEWSRKNPGWEDVYEPHRYSGRATKRSPRLPMSQYDERSWYL